MTYSAGVMPDNIRLVWPSEKFARTCKQKYMVAFFSPDAWKMLGRDGAQDSFCHYDVTEGWKETRDKRMPHMKCMFRMLSSKKKKNACPEFEWIYMGSMCLSRGANGALTCEKHNQNYQCSCNPKLMKREFRIRNFEMGVLFHSRSNRRLVAVETRWPKCEVDFTEFPMPFKILPRKYRLNRENPRRGDLPYFNVKGDMFQHVFAPDFNTETENIEKSNKMCICFQNGVCRRGASCRYVHGYKEFRDGKVVFRSLEDFKNDDDDDDDDDEKSEKAVVVEEEAKVKEENMPLNERCVEEDTIVVEEDTIVVEEDTIVVEEDTIVVEEKKMMPFKERCLTFDNVVFMALQRKLKRRKCG